MRGPGWLRVPGPCTVTEDDLDPADLPEDWTWGVPVIEPVPMEIGPGENIATVTNQAADGDGTFSVSKQVEDEDGIAGDTEFSFTLTAGQTWHSQDDAGLETPEGAECTVTEQEPEAPGEGYSWSTEHAVDGGEAQEGSSASAVIPVEDDADHVEFAFTNTLDGSFGDFSVLKTPVPEDDPLPEGAGFDFTWQCTTPEGTVCTVTEAEPGQFTLTDGQAMEFGPIPEGSACTVEEAAPESEDGTWETSVELDVEGGASEGRSVFFTIPQEDGAPAVGATFTNTLTADEEPSPTPTTEELTPTDVPTPTEPETPTPTPTDPTETPVPTETDDPGPPASPEPDPSAPSPTVTQTQTVAPPGAGPESPEGEPGGPGTDPGPGSPDAPGDDGPPEGRPSPGEGMPQTGAPAGLLTMAALALLALGGALTYWVRRRNS